VDVFKKFKGIHNFMNWPRSVLTDSGGFQIFCLPNSRVMKEDGAYFKSYVDNTTICLSPERSIETQIAIGSDIMMVLDQCVPSTVDHNIAKSAMELTHRWALRSLKARGDSPQAMFGIVQGACYTDLRIESAKAIVDMPFDGYAIGGLAVGETMNERHECTAIVTEYLPANKPRYLMGVGTPLDLLEAVHRGVDMFDCILPTSMAQQGKAFTSLGRRDLRRGIYKDLDEPLDASCDCYTCKTYSLAYLYHICRVHESQAWQLLGIHNVHFYMKLTSLMREHILNDTWLPFYQEQREILDQRDSYGPKSNRYAKVQRSHEKLKLGSFEIVSESDDTIIKDVSTETVVYRSNSNLKTQDTRKIEVLPILERLSEDHEKEFVLWELGLGCAEQAMSLIQLIESLPEGQQKRKMVMLSFESDLDALRLALRFPSRFHHVRHPAPSSLVKSGSWSSKQSNLTWIVQPDFKLDSALQNPTPDVIKFHPNFKQTNDIAEISAFLSKHLPRASIC
jgi:queuine tRNA-ribosyltransferase